MITTAKRKRLGTTATALFLAGAGVLSTGAAAPFAVMAPTSRTATEYIQFVALYPGSTAKAYTGALDVTDVSAIDRVAAANTGAQLSSAQFAGASTSAKKATSAGYTSAANSGVCLDPTYRNDEGDIRVAPCRKDFRQAFLKQPAGQYSWLFHWAADYNVCLKAVESHTQGQDLGLRPCKNESKQQWYVASVQGSGGAIITVLRHNWDWYCLDSTYSLATRCGQGSKFNIQKKHLWGIRVGSF